MPNFAVLYRVAERYGMEGCAKLVPEAGLILEARLWLLL